MRIVEKELRRIARRRIARRRRTLPRPFWLRIHASKPAPWLRPPPDGAFASVPAFATCASMFIPLGVDGAAEDAAASSRRSKAPSPNDCVNDASALVAGPWRVRSYTARFCASTSVSYARWIAAHASGSPPRSGWFCSAVDLYAARTSSCDAVGATRRSSYGDFSSTMSVLEELEGRRRREVDPRHNLDRSSNLVGTRDRPTERRSPGRTAGRAPLQALAPAEFAARPHNCARSAQ